VLANDSDPDGDALTVSAFDATSAQGGSVSCTPAGACVYTPKAGFSGVDTFGYTISDGHGGTAQGLVTVTVKAAPPANHAPDAVNDAARTEEGKPITGNVLANDGDPDGDKLTLSAFDTTSAQGGSVRCTPAGDCTYTPKAGFTGTDTFGYTISDGRSGSDSAIVTIEVKPAPVVNRGPIARNDKVRLTITGTITVTSVESATLNVLLNDSDPDGNTLLLADYDEESVMGGQVVCEPSGLCTYTPLVGFAGRDKFTYTVSDSRGGSDVGVVHFLVEYVSDVGATAKRGAQNAIMAK